jgi:chromosome segregation ATPase
MLQTVRAEAATARGGLGVAAIVGAVVTLAITLFVFYLTSTNQRIDGLQRDMGGQATTLAQHEHQLSDLASVNAHTTIPHHGQQLTELEAKVKQIENVASDLRDLKRTAQQDHDQLIALDPRRVRTQLDEQQSSLSGLTLQVERMWRALGGQTRELGEQSGPLTGQ